MLSPWFLIKTIVFIFIVLFIFNFLSGGKGTYTNYSRDIINLLNKPIGTQVKSVKNFVNSTGKIASGQSVVSKNNISAKYVSKGELECRRVLEKLFKKPFPNQRPSFLKNPVTGHNLELDCFNQELKLACEYNGSQHEFYSPNFHKSYESFQIQKYRDEIKKQLCRENGITLLIVPYTIPIHEIENYIIKKLQ